MRACLLRPPYVGGLRRWLEPVLRQLADRSADAADDGIRLIAPAAFEFRVGVLGFRACLDSRCAASTGGMAALRDAVMTHP